MRDVHVRTNKCEFLVFRRARRGRRTVVLFLVTVMLSLAASMQAEEMVPTPLDRDALIAAADQARTEARFSDAIRLYSRAEKDFGSDSKVFRGRAISA